MENYIKENNKYPENNHDVVSYPSLSSIKPMQETYRNFQDIDITSDNFTLGRSLKNTVTIPFLAISRNHCIIRKSENNEWILEDQSTLGIRLNGQTLGKGISHTISNGDVIVLEPSEEFVYRFYCPDNDDFEIPKKRIKLEKPEPDTSSILNNVKMKFEESQIDELKHVEHKLQSTKHLHSTSIILKEQLRLDMNRKVENLKNDFAQQIASLEGEKNEVEKQKALLIEERDAQLAQVKNEMEEKIAELMEQIQKHNEAESELLKENNSLKEKLDKEREDFLLELNRESSSKLDMLEKLNAKIREQEEVRLKEKQELEALLRKETDQLRLAKEKELKELEAQKQQRELELELELNEIKKNLTEQVNLTEHQKLKAEEQLNLQMEEMKKLSSEDKIKMDLLLKEREEIQKQLIEAQENAEKSLSELQKRVSDRETELAALAATRIQQHAEQSSEVINTLQAQLEKMKNQLECVEMEKNILLESVCTENPGEGTSKQTTLTEMGELMESELQCSICAELFIEATTLNCSHTFCKYCINMWKKKKKDCPICRSSITSENRSLVLDTFIEKMVQTLTEEMKTKRKDILKFRAELVSEMARQTAGTSRTSVSFNESEISEDDEYLEEEEEDYYENEYDIYSYDFSRRSRGFYYDNNGFPHTDSGSDESSEAGESDGAPADSGGATAGAHNPGAPSDPTAPGAQGASTAAGAQTRPRSSGRRVPGVPGSYYGGYGRCFSCGSRGHWAPGCPFR